MNINHLILWEVPVRKSSILWAIITVAIHWWNMNFHILVCLTQRAKILVLILPPLINPNFNLEKWKSLTTQRLLRIVRGKRASIDLKRGDRSLKKKLGEACKNLLKWLNPQIFQKIGSNHWTKKKLQQT